jgi:hypothetical protein
MRGVTHPGGRRGGAVIYNTKWFGPFTKNVHDVRFCPIGDAQDIRQGG